MNVIAGFFGGPEFAAATSVNVQSSLMRFITQLRQLQLVDTRGHIKGTGTRRAIDQLLRPGGGRSMVEDLRLPLSWPQWSGLGIEASDQRMAELLRRCPQLRRLDATDIDPRALHAHQHLVSLRLAFTSRTALDALSVVPELASLRSFELLGGAVPDQALAPLRHANQLESLRLQSCSSVTDEGLRSLPRALRSLALRHMDKLTAAGLECLQALPVLESLEVTFSDCADDLGARHIAGLQGLRHLSLAGATLLTDAGLAHLSRLRDLQHIDLSGCLGLTRNGVARLAASLPGVQIEWTPPAR